MAMWNYQRDTPSIGEMQVVAHIFLGGPKTVHPEMTVKADHCHGSTSKLEPVDHGLDSVFVGRGIHRVVYISVYIYSYTCQINSNNADNESCNTQNIINQFFTAHLKRITCNASKLRSHASQEGKSRPQQLKGHSSKWPKDPKAIPTTFWSFRSNVWNIIMFDTYTWQTVGSTKAILLVFVCWTPCVWLVETINQLRLGGPVGHFSRVVEYVTYLFHATHDRVESSARKDIDKVADMLFQYGPIQYDTTPLI